jgi:hypothetical protein
MIWQCHDSRSIVAIDRVWEWWPNFCAVVSVTAAALEVGMMHDVNGEFGDSSSGLLARIAFA